MTLKPSCLSLLLLVAACDPSIDPATLPPLPPIAKESFLPVVRDQLDALQAKVDRDPLDGAAAAELGIACLVYQQHQAAAVALERAVLIRPDRPDWRFFHGEALARLGRVDDALATWREALARAPTDSAIRTRLAQLEMQRGALAEAGAQLQAVLEDEPGYAPARLQLARLAIRAGRPQDAIGELERLLATVGPAADIYFTLAEAYRLQGDGGAAAANLELFERHRGVTLTGGDPLLTRVREVDATGRRQLHEAQRLLQRGQLDEAARLLNEVLALDAANLTAQAGLISLYAMRGEFALADRQFDRALQAVGPSAVLYRSLGRARLEENRVDEADAALAQALRLNPDDAEACAWRGVVRRLQGRTAAAESLFQEALARDPDNRLAHQHLAELRLSQGRHEAAIDHLRRLLAQETAASPGYWRALGDAWLTLARTDEAIAAYEAGIESAIRQGNRREESLIGSALRVARLKADK